MYSLLHTYRTIIVSVFAGFITGLLVKASYIIFNPVEKDRKRTIAVLSRSGAIWGLMFGLTVFPLFSEGEFFSVILGAVLSVSSVFIEFFESVFFKKEADEKREEESS